jgi:hypothetical protein
VAITYGSWWRSGIAVAAASGVQGREWLQLVRAVDGDLETEQEAIDADLIPPHRLSGYWEVDECLRRAIHSNLTMN